MIFVTEPSYNKREKKTRDTNSLAQKTKKIYNEKMDKKTEKAESLNTIRINKFLSEAGICSRREADGLIDEKRITINGIPAQNGDKVCPNDVVELDGRKIVKEERKVLLLFYKPRGIVCSTKKQRQEVTVTDYLKYPVRIYPVGRLDKESEGLLLMTNQGDLVNRIMRAGNWHEKEYLVKVDKAVTESFLKDMSCGVPILDTVTRPCRIERTGEKSFRIILTQGLNRQIRRMCEYFGYRVVSLKRIRIMNLEVKGLLPGQYREATSEEWRELQKMIKNSSNETTGKTGGRHGREIHKENERIGRNTECGGKGVLSGRPGNHEQQRIRRSVRPSCQTGGRDRNRSGKQSHR